MKPRIFEGVAALAVVAEQGARHVAARPRPRAPRLAVGLLGTYPPTRCGIATFTAALRSAMSYAGDGGVWSGVVRSVDRRNAPSAGSEVIEELVPLDPGSRLSAARALSSFDVAIVQHEFGIFGGPDGVDVLDVVERITAPVIVILHTVLRTPSPSQRMIIERLARAADVLVVQSQAAKLLLHQHHTVAASKVRVVPHGARLNLEGATPCVPPRRPTILTWGLISRGKGLEFGVQALAALRDLQPLPRYLIAGQTHPHVVAAEGETYRSSLIELAKTMDVSSMVEFDNSYTTTEQVLARARAADIVMLPYLSNEQVVSGVLVEALASGKPVVATAFPHAEEMLSAGSGIVVPCGDGEALGAALRTLLTDSDAQRRMSIVARHQAQSLTWETVGQTYLDIARSLIATPTRRRQHANVGAGH